MVRWAAFAGVVSVLVTLLLALTRSSAAVVRETEPDETDSNTTTRVREALGSPDASPLPFGGDEEPPLSGSGGTELTTLDESDYPDPPAGGTRPDDRDEATAETHDDPPDPSEAFPISGEAEHPGSEDTESARDGPRPDDPLPRPNGEPSDRTSRGDRRDDTPDDRPTDPPDETRAGDATGDDTAVDDGTPNDTEPRPGVATATADPDGLTPDAFDGPDPFAGETDGFDPRLPSERDGVRVGDRELSTTVVLANVVGSQLLFAGLLAAVTVWAAVPAVTLGLGSVTLSQVGVGALL
ncbi:MAG: hypothetical protein J07HB67_01995, partial [halophilic archaeon J07HB67]